MKEKKYMVKKFFTKVICFCKQTWYLAKLIFGKKDNTKVEYRDLAPIDDASGCEEHIKALEWAVSSNRIKNIALSGPYGSGKSSIIETFLRRNPLLCEKSIKISLATFTEETEEAPAVTPDNLEEGILKQLFYKIKQSKIPQSRYRKLHRIEYWPIYGKTVLCSVIALVFLFVFWPNTFSAGYDLILDAGSRIYRGAVSIAQNNLFGDASTLVISTRVLAGVTLSLFACVSLLVLAGFARVLQLFAARLSIKEIKLPSDTTVGTREADSESVFNKNMDEIVYFFEATGYRLVFIEDLDRFKEPEIFIRLRELNTLLNNCETIKGNVVFIYAICDDIFKDSERTKFFDFIIPVIPVINSTNSGESLLEMLHQSNQKGTKHDISRGYVLDIFPFISDMRIMQNIYNEFILYKATLKTGQKLALDDEQIMSLIVFKNLYPGEFAELQAEKGIVKEAFLNKSQFVEKKRDAIQTQIDAKALALDSIAADTLDSAKELKYLMLCAISAWKGIAYRVQIHGGAQYSADAILADNFEMSNLLKKERWIVYYSTKTGTTSSDWLDVPSLCSPYIERYKYLQHSCETEQQAMKAEIESLEGNIRSISSLTLRSLIEQYGADEVLISESVKSNDLLVFLLRKGYINEEYAGCINFFKANSISTGDMNFILSIKNQKALPFTYGLTKIPEMLERLQVHEFGEKAILNFCLLKHMLSVTHYDAQLRVLFQQLSNESTTSWNFINEFIDYKETQKYFVKRLATAWPGLWESVYYNNTLTYDRKIEYMEWLLYYADLDTLKQQNQGRLISRFFIEHDDILQKLPTFLAVRVTEIISALNVVFVKIKIDGVPAKVLDFVFDNGYYELNADMIRSIVTYKNASLVGRLEEQNYTVIAELGYDALTNNIHDNWEAYVDHIVLAKENTQESVDSVLVLLERSIANQSKCKQIISHEKFHVDDITRVCANIVDVENEKVQAIWDMLLDAAKVTVSWDNVYAYWRAFSVTQALLDYMSTNCQILSFSDCWCLDDNFKSEIILSELGLKAFVEILPCLRMEKFNITLADISIDKLGAMIQNRNFNFTAEDYKELLICAPNLCSQFILLNQDSFAREIDCVKLTEPIFESLIMSDNMSTTIKEHIVNRDGTNLMTETAAIYLCQLDISLDRSVFKVIWDKIDVGRRKSFLFKHIERLEADDFDHYFVELGYPYEKLKRTPYRHDEFIPDTPQNRKLVGRLQYLQYLTSCEYEMQTQHGPKHTEKKVPVIRCRVKVKPEATVPAKAK